MSSTTHTPEPSTRATPGPRIAFAVGGILAVIVGVLILVWPAKTAIAITVVVAIYAIAAGLVYAGLGIWSKGRGGWSRFGHIVLGLLFVAAGIIAFLFLSTTTAALAFALGMIIGIMWIVEGIVALSTLRDSSSRGWTVFFALLSIGAGIVMLFAPGWGIALLYWLLGISLVVLGIVQIVRAVSYGRKSAAASGA